MKRFIKKYVMDMDNLDELDIAFLTGSAILVCLTAILLVVDALS